ncbi:hypothetical protein [Haladaptatus sp. DYF46]|uniref:hypothetical protein n=1 Tax=Haladaptatus sp. DYF46 TaxID=2886041 RepID=UPI001E3DDAF5|nr:hypothetical protein [Haladaptatus sp. DYF46]
MRPLKLALAWLFACFLLTVFAAVPLLAGIVVGSLGLVVFVAIAYVTMKTPVS